MRLTVNDIKYNVEVEVEYDDYDGESWNLKAIPEDKNRKIREAYGPIFDRTVSKLIETIKVLSWQEE